MSTFKIVLTGIFAFCIVIGIAIFALSKSSSSQQYSKLLIWGPLTSDQFDQMYRSSSLKQNKYVSVTYVQKDPSAFDTDFVEALADGAGPDIVILREDSMYKNRNKLFTIPYKNYTERTFKDTFIEGSEVFLAPDGVVAVPLMVDPMVMYWNRDLFSNALIAKPPQYWNEIYDLIGKMTKKDSSATVTQSAIALGEWRNITNAKEILAMILEQAGTPITARDTQGVSSVLNDTFNYPVAPSQSAVNFYTQFSNPTSPNYTWNRSLPSSYDYFVSGKLATYFGFASEIFSIQQKNANLNFDVTYVPQIKDAQKKIVFGHMYGMALVKQSKQISVAFSAITSFTEPASLTTLEKQTNLPPVRRDLLSAKPTDDFRVVFYNSALLAHSWIDPDPAQSTNIFRDMIESITSGRARVSEALSSANDQLNSLFVAK